MSHARTDGVGVVDEPLLHLRLAGRTVEVEVIAAASRSPAAHLIGQIGGEYHLARMDNGAAPATAINASASSPGHIPAAHGRRHRSKGHR